jgi:Zn-dependent membrane protease YugP
LQSLVENRADQGPVDLTGKEKESKNMLGFDPVYFVFVIPAFLLSMWAQYRVKAAYAAGMQEPSTISGATAARRMLDDAGLSDVVIEETPGELSDHYDPSTRVVRLSTDVYRSRTLAAVGIAAHEVGHAIQHARHYAPLVIRNAAVPAATVGPMLSFGLLMLGALFAAQGSPLGKLMIIGGIAAFGGIVFFQLVNLPVEFDASNRAKQYLNQMGVVDQQGAVVVRQVLDAAALTYVAATLQSVLTLAYYIFRFSGFLRSNDE